MTLPAIPAYTGSGNPFDNRNPVDGPDRLFGRDAVIGRILRNVVATTPQCWNLHGEPRSGRSSVLHALGAARHWVQHLGLTVDLDDHLFVVAGLQGLPAGRPALAQAAFWHYAFRKVHQAAVGREWATPSLKRLHSASAGLSDPYGIVTGLEDYLLDLRPIGRRRRVVLLLDDFDVVMNGYDREDVEQVTRMLRALAQGQDIALVISTVAPLGRLFAARGLAQVDSPLTNILDDAALGALEGDGARQMVLAPWKGPRPPGQAAFGDDDARWILDTAGRQPEPLRILCGHVFDARRDGAPGHAEARARFDRDPHVRWLYQRWIERADETVVDGARLGDALRALASPSADRAVPDAIDLSSTEALRRLGLVEIVDGRPRPMGEAFRDFLASRAAERAVGAAGPASGAIAAADPATPEPRSRSNGAAPIHTAADPAVRVRPPTARQRYDAHLRLAHVGPATVRLSASEFRLFRALADHAGEACSHRALRTAVWGERPPASPDALQQLVKRIREKLAAAGARPDVIDTLHGQGYALNEANLE